MFIHTIESLEEFEDYIKQLDEHVGLTPETYKEVMDAISKEREKLKKTITADVIVTNDTTGQDMYAFWKYIQGTTCSHCRGTGKDGHDRCDPPNYYTCEHCNGSGRTAI